MTDSSEAETDLQIRVETVTPLQQNASLVWSPSSREGVFVDPGGEIDRLMNVIEETDVKLVAIWLTHGHVDHVGAATEMKERTGCPIIGPHTDDQFLLELVETQAAAYGIAGGRSVEPDRFLDDGDFVELAGIKFDVLHCPGHSPGHIVFHQPEADFAFSGDVLFQGSIGRTDLPRGNHEQLVNSIVTKLWPLGNSLQFIPGHGPASSIGDERRSNPFVGDHVLGT